MIIINGQNDIIFSKSESGWPDDPCPVYVWDLSSNHVQEIGEFTYFIELCHLDVQENTLVVFEAVWETNPLEVHKTKWSTTTGQLLEEKVLHLPLPADGPLERSSTDRGRFRIYGSKSVAHSIWSNKDSKVWFYLEYNHSVDKLNVRSIHCCEPPGLHYYEVSGARLTRDLFYSFSRKKADYVAVYDASTGKATWHSVRVSTGTSPRSIPEQSWEESVPYWSEYAYYGFPNKYEVFGDREVFGFAGTHGVELWFFNPDYVPDPRDWKWLWGEIPMLDASQARS